MTLTIQEFIRRFLLHVVPKGFVRIRYFGFLSSRSRATKLQLCMVLSGKDIPLNSAFNDDVKESNNNSNSQEKFPDELCPLCKEGRLKPYRQILKPDPGGNISQAA